MKKKHLIRIWILLSLVAVAGCNMPASEEPSQEINITQAYQTIEAHLTEAVGQPLKGSTETPTAPPAPTDSGDSTPVESPTATATVQPTVSAAPNCDQAAAAYPKIDITIDDNTELAPGQKFTKIWRVVNVGQCTWTPEYTVVLFSGDRMGAAEGTTLTENIAPNQTVDISVDMIAPEQPGVYQGNWKLRNAAGEYFGIGPGGSSPFWVRINVVQTLTSTPTTAPTPTTEPLVQASGPLTLAKNDFVDLDYLVIDSAAGDLQYRFDAPAEHQLIPQGSVVWGVFGDNQPGLGDCQSASLASTPLVIENIAVGTYICYRTDLSLLGWMRYDLLDTGDNSLTLEMLTWQTP
ncbi:MAG: NBR1-Ig-like domain-containing protein [Chloroflexota bacterium]